VLKTGGRDKVYAFFKSERVRYSDTTGWLCEHFYRQLNNEKNYENRLSVALAPLEDLRVTLLYHITRGRGPTANVSIVPYKDFLLLLNQRKSVDNYQQGIFQGLVAILFNINFFYFLLTRDSAYLAYSLHNFFIYPFTSSLYGYLYLAFIDYDPILKYLVDNMFLLASILFYFMFLRNFVNTKERYPVWHNITIFLTYAIYALLAITSVLIYFYQAAYLPYDIRKIVILLCMVLDIAFIVQLSVSGDLRDRLFATGTSALVIFAFISIAAYFMRENFNSDKILQVGIVLLLSHFSIALAIRNREIEYDKVEAQVALIDQLNENEKLKNQFIDRFEHEAKQRTDEISTQNEELIQQKEELMAQREMLERQKRVIEANFEELSAARNFLEMKVNERTEKLAKSNSELVQQNSQLEQYAFITAHNLRAPVARLLGCTHLFHRLSGKDQASREISEHVKKATKDMGKVITDLNKILEKKA
jgi:hypothetical protein